MGGQSSLRLESYLFTVEAMEAAREHLTDDGVFAMYNYYREPWLVDRLAGTLDAAYGYPPCVDTVGDVGHLAVITIARDPAALDCPADSAWVASDPAAAASPATDDYPFLYLRTRSIPDFYLITLALILVMSLVMVRSVSGPLRPMRGYLDLFFMGVAFLLLETKSVIQFALLFGTTWFVNALVFAGVLIAVLMAVEVARRVTLPRLTYLYGALLVALMIAWIVPVDALLSLDPAPRFVVATTLWFTPIFIANLVFAQRFRTVEASNIAFGANLLRRDGGWCSRVRVPGCRLPAAASAGWRGLWSCLLGGEIARRQKPLIGFLQLAAVSNPSSSRTWTSSRRTSHHPASCAIPRTRGALGDRSRVSTPYEATRFSHPSSAVLIFE